jgi:MoaE-MoaD fusion protein
LRIRIRYFAIQRQLLGRTEEQLELAPGSSVAAAWQAITERHPELAPSSRYVRFARNGQYVDEAQSLESDDELAVIPPIAGGADARIRLDPQALTAETLAELMGQVGTDSDGAVVSFVGRTRATAGTPAPGQEGEAERFAGQRVVRLSYEAYEEMALGVLRAIAAEIETRWGITGVGIVHRTGPVAVGETSVIICAAAAHRDAAFEACRYAIEELKARAPIWKSEEFADGSVWLGSPARPAPTPSHASAGEER